MSEPALKLLVCAAGDWEETWLTSSAWPSEGFETLLLRPGDSPSGPCPPGVRVQSVPIVDTGRRPALPDLGTIVKVFDDFQPDACLCSDSRFFCRLVRLFSLEREVPVFRLVSEEGELSDRLGSGDRTFDFRLLTNSQLVEKALADDQFGSSLFLTGHPARDLVLGAGAVGTPFADLRYGDGLATGRILDLVRRGRRGSAGFSRPELSVIVPAYKESANLQLVCDRLLEVLGRENFSSEILLIDDASPDDTYAVAIGQMFRSPRIRAFSKPTPRGMGNGIRYGLDRARADIIAVTMGDGSDEVARIPEMYRKVRDEGYGLAIGSRYRFRENYQAVPRLYRFWSAIFRLTTRVVVGFSLRDYTNSFRLFHRRIFQRYGPESGGFEISPEITFKAWFATRRVAEVDVRHLKRATGQSKFSFLRAGPGYGRILIKAFVNRLTGRWFTLDW